MQTNNLYQYGGGSAAGNDYARSGTMDDLEQSLLQNQLAQDAATQQSNQKTSRTNASLQSNVEMSEIEIGLFNRLLKTGVIRASPGIKTLHDRGLVVLDQASTARYLNGQIFANYLVVLKEVLATTNQDFGIDPALPIKLKDQVTPQARLFNWNYLCNELDKIGIIIENDVKSLYVAGDSEEIGKLFTRIERYMKRISGDDAILNFQDYRKDDRKFTPHQGGDLNSGLEPGAPTNGRRGLGPHQKKQVKDGVDIMQMDTTKDPSDTDSTLEFILNTLCRALSMKPKQSAALLTNNNQFLTHCVVKGVKGRYEPMVNWYQDIYQYSKHLTAMLEAEVENARASQDEKTIKASQQNCEKVLQTIACGCYSNNFEVAHLCMKTLSCMALDFSGNIELVTLTNKWFQSKDSGFYNINYGFKKHPELAEEFVNAIGNFTGGGEQMQWVYLQLLHKYYPDNIDYFNTLNTLLPYFSIKHQEEMTSGNFLSQLIEKGIRFADLEPGNSYQVRVAALSLLGEIWLSFSTHIDKQNQYSQPLQHVFKKNSRDRIRSVRIVTATLMFKLLDKFSVEKNSAAPSLYKSLIFSLVESPQDQTIRELYLTNFQYLFETVKSIPIGLLIDPFVKSNQLSDNFQFQTFDYDFFAFLAQHPKLNANNSIQILDLLAKLYLNDLCNASAASVPFILICQRHLNNIQCQEFIMKFITISLNQLLELDTVDESQSHKTPMNSANQKILALPAPSPAQRAGSSQKLSKDFRISSSKKKKQVQDQRRQNGMVSQEDQVNNRLKKSLIITILLKIQNLRQDDINNAMRDMLLGAQKQYKDQNNGYLNNGIMAVLKYWGDPDLMFNQYLKRLEKIEVEEAKAQERLQRQEMVERRMLGYESDEKPQSVGTSLKGMKSLKNVKGTGRNSMALMPITENQQNQRALHEIEMIKKFKKDRELDEKKQQEQYIRKKTKNEVKMREELARRRVEKGVAEFKGGVKQEVRALILKADEVQPQATRKHKNPLDQQLQLVDITEEEDRDQEIIISFMKRYAKIWKFLFSRYANQCYSTKGKLDFDDMGKKTSQINQAEITKLLRDHGTYPKLVSKDEIQSLMRLINMQSTAENASDIAMLDYSQYLQFIPQLAFLAFSRAPIDKSNFPPIESLNALLSQFEEATRGRGKSTALYEDPDQTGVADRELLTALNAKLAVDPTYPIPQGFRKQVEKTPIYQFKVPECAKSILKEGQVVATEMFDAILFEAIGVHFLEPQVSFEMNYKVKPAITKAGKDKPQAEALGYMKKAEKKAENASQNKATAYAMMSAADKRREALEVKPKLSLALKLQVTKQDLKNRPHYQEVAEVFEEILQATEKGLYQLPPRLNRAPGQYQNPHKKEQAQYEQEQKDRDVFKEERRKKRDDHVKKIIKDTDYGGRGLPMQKFKKQQTINESKEKERLEKEARKEFIEQHKGRQTDVYETRAAQMEQLNKRKNEESAKSQVDDEEKRQKTKAFLQKQKTELRQGFKEMSKKRDEVVLRKEEQEELKKVNEDRLKAQMTQYIEDSKVDRDQEKNERGDVNEFLQTREVIDVFNNYNKQLAVMFKFFAAQDSKKDQASFDLQYLHDTLSFKELVRFGYQQNLTPNYVTPEDLVYCYKSVIREITDIEKQTQGKIDFRKSGMIDYENFKKVIVRIASVAQEKLGVGANEDRLAQKLQNDQTNAEEREAKREKFKQKNAFEKNQKKEEMDKLREQFQKEQQYKSSSLSKADTKNKNEKEREVSEFQRKKKEQIEYALNEAKLDQEEEFFKKWLKQRENLGVSGAAPVQAQGSDEDSEAPPLRSQRTTKDASKNLLKKKDAMGKELQELNKQVEQQKKLNNYKIEQKQVRKQLDVSIISSRTIEALFNYLDLNADDTEYDVNKKLNNTLINRRGTMGSKDVSQRGNSPVDGRRGQTEEPIMEQDGEQDGFMRE